MANSGVKWSDDIAFPEGWESQIGDKIVGLRGNQNFKFSFPSTGIKDGNGNYLIQWGTTGGNASNYLKFRNGQSGMPTKIISEGSDANVDIDVDLKGTGVLDVNGLLTVNGSTSINSIIDDDTMASATNKNVPTAESVVAYIDGLPPHAGGDNAQMQYNNSGMLDGDTGFTTDGSGTLSITTQLSVSNVKINGNTISSTDTNGNIIFQPDGTGSVLINGFFNLNGSTPINAVINDGTMATATASNVPTANSVVSYISSLPTNAGGSNTHFQYNNLGTLAGDTGFTTNGAGNLTVTGKLSVDNINIDANSIISTNTNGAINITPNGTGNIFLKGVNWSGLTDGQLFIGSTGNVPSLASLTSGNGINITNGVGSITIDAKGRGQEWIEITGISANMVVNKAYIANNAAEVELRLPATSSIGDTLVVQGKGAGKWKILQNAGQSIVYSDKSTTVGVTGNLTPAKQYDSVQMVCITEDTVWAVHTSPVANYTPA